MAEVVVTGIGPVLANCADRHTLWSQLKDGPSQLVFEPAPGARDGERWPVGRVSGFAAERWLGRFPRNFYDRAPRDQQLYLAAVMIALDDAALAPGGARTGIFDGTSRGSFDYWCAELRSGEPATRRALAAGTPGQAANLAAALLGVRGPAYTLSNTCCSGAAAIDRAYRAVQAGELDVALASGHDAALAAPIYEMYREAGLLTGERDDARHAIRPFVAHSRNAFGEGAVVLVLESRAHAERRGARILAVITGSQLGNHGHPLRVDPEGQRAGELIDDVLGAAGVAREAVGFVVGHGNGMLHSDRSELAYMARVFAARAPEVPLLSVKPVYGHLFGASSALNVAAAILMLHHGWLVPTLNVDPAHCTLDHLASGGRASAASAGLAVSYGLGGHSAVTLLEAA